MRTGRTGCGVTIVLAGGNMNSSIVLLLLCVCVCVCVCLATTFSFFAGGTMDARVARRCNTGGDVGVIVDWVVVGGGTGLMREKSGSAFGLLEVRTPVPLTRVR